MVKYHPVSPDGLTKTGAIVGLIWWALALGWHGMMGMPSMMGLLYSYPYMSMMMQSLVFVLLVGGGALTGWLVAVVYNRSIGAK
ncbi:MAG: hypothetical protein HYS81_03420 [Candidatus Aenigmatarchaeota archaeon]|nr:MAG: hypothetical protein HYS81_03420 [Candidatus Aenigmarchaeota archaeon]